MRRKQERNDSEGATFPYIVSRVRKGKRKDTAWSTAGGSIVKFITKK